MTFPTQSAVEVPLLRVLENLGGEARPRDVYSRVAQLFPDLTDEEQNQRMEGSPSSRKWWNHVQWARQRLVDRGEIDGTTHGVWKITERGHQRLLANETPPVRESNHTSTVVATPANVDIPSASKLTLSDLVNDSVEQLKKRLVGQLQELSPSAFEKFCSALLGQLGYEEIVVTSRSRDGGIDGFGEFRQGVVRLKSAFQSKRWKDAVGRPEIDAFRGSIQGEFDHGVFLTTSRFTQEAQVASVKRGAITILLLDGGTIAQLMIDRGLGVAKQPIYLADIDPDFFDFEE